MRLGVPPPFPTYTPAERIADGAVHAVGLALGGGAAAWLVLHLLGLAAPSAILVPVLVYLAGLLGMLGASACYNLAPPGRLKALFRRFDHGMIFVMIAGSYTPFALLAMRPRAGVPLCAIVWALALVGICVRLLRPEAERLALALYLGMGWMVLAFMPALVASAPAMVVGLLVGGGVVYSIGSFVHMRQPWRYANASWHALVVVAAALHLAAVTLAVERAV